MAVISGSPVPPFSKKKTNKQTKLRKDFYNLYKQCEFLHSQSMHRDMMFYSHTIQHILHHFLFCLGSRLHSLSVHPNPVLWVRQQVTPFCQVSSTLVDITATKRFMKRFRLDVKSVFPDIKAFNKMSKQIACVAIPPPPRDNGREVPSLIISPW